MLILSAILITSFDFSFGSDVVCYNSRFQPRCFSNEMIAIKEAYYGRKTLEDCMIDEGNPTETNLRDPSFIGCFTDVKNVVGEYCAGKQECDVVIADIKTETSCYKYLKHYLFASFECIKVVAGSGTCSLKASSDKQHVSNIKRSASDCGSVEKPWRTESLVGQNINISLMHINGNYAAFAKDISGQCDKLGSVVDVSNKKRMDICSTKRASEKSSFYVSESNDVHITFEENRKVSGFVVTVQATGCSDLIPPADAWLKRTENEATIGCYSTRLRWQLKCLGQRWIGVIGNCSYGHVIIHNVETETENEKPTNQIVIVFMIVVAGLVMCLLIGCLGLICLKRYYAISKLKGLKQMNALVDNFQPVYDKDRLNKDPSSFGANSGGTLSNGKALNGSIGNPDNAQYFELDQSIVNKEFLN